MSPGFIGDFEMYGHSPGYRRLLALAAAVSLPAYAQQTPLPRDLPLIEIIGTPLPGASIPRDAVPANVQSVTGGELRSQRSTSVADFLNRNLASVSVNEAQSNPFQPDVSFRGFTATPLLGNPIGISVFVDGVRVNESFGDTVFWDLIPTAAITTIDLLPGADPVFGLNTLGGALSVRTRSGREDPGLTADLSTGSFGRRSAQVTAGGATEVLDGFLAAQYYEEDGWRDHSPSEVKQLFGKAGWESGANSVNLSYTYADNTLTGNGLVPESLLEERREAVYSYPDETRPELHFAVLTGRHDFGRGLELTANVYRRELRVGTFNGDAEFDDDELEYEAENRRTRTRQTTNGGTLQLSYGGTLGGHEHRLALGVSRDKGEARFEQLEQEADFTPDRGTEGEGDFELDTHVEGRNTYDGVYLSDVVAFGDRTHLTMSGRYNRAKVSIEDLTGEEPDLNGRHSFSRFNPAAGLTFALSPAATIYGRYNEGFRVPTPVELTCASPEDPCALPVGFVADPPLDPVVARSWEAGARGDLAGNMRWNVTAYRTRLTDDILFTSVGASQGFFANVPSTRRQGVELGLVQRTEKLDWMMNYAYVDATFRTDTEIFNPVASELDGAQPETIQVQSGDRMPGLPDHLIKAAAEYRVTPSFQLGANILYASSQRYRGDEGNDFDELGGYAVVGVRAAYQFLNGMQLYAKADNVFDREYNTLGAFNRNAFDDDSEPREELGPVQRFVSPAAPRSFWVGVQYSLARR